MSDLKHQTPEQLKVSLRDCQEYIANLTNTLNGQNVRLSWIKQYLFEKTPQELTMAQVEQKLGHRLILK